MASLIVLSQSYLLACVPFQDDEVKASGDGAEMTDGSDDDEYAQAPKKRSTAVKGSGSAAGLPNAAALLYGEEGQVNPHAARAEKKKLKKASAKTSGAVPSPAAAAAKGKGAQATELGEDSDFEFHQSSGDDKEEGSEEGSEEEGEGVEEGSADEMSD